MRCHFFFDINLEQNKKNTFPTLWYLYWQLEIQFTGWKLQTKSTGSFVKGHAANHFFCYRMQTVLYPSTKMQSFSSQWIHFLFDATVDVTEIIRETTTKQILAKLLCITCFIKIYTMFLLSFRI